MSGVECEEWEDILPEDDGVEPGTCRECGGAPWEGTCQCEPPDTYADTDAGDMDGDAASALASAGFGTDEDYE